MKVLAAALSPQPFGAERAVETNLVQFLFKRLGSGLWLDAEIAPGGQQQFSREHVHRMRVRSEGEALKAIEAAGIGHWTTFPHDGIQSTVTRLQLRTIGFRGNY